MGKVKLIMEMEVPENLSKFYIDSVLCEALECEGCKNVCVIGPYTDEKGKPVTTDLFVTDKNIEELICDMLAKEGVSEEQVHSFVRNEEEWCCFYNEWLAYVQNDKGGMNSSSYIKKTALKYIAKVAKTC